MQTTAQPAVDVIGADPRPRFFPLEQPFDHGVVAPAGDTGVRVRTYVRALSGMQKEAVVLDVASGSAWRLVSDEGPYLSGFDAAPCPLGFMTTGMLAGYADVVRPALEAAGVAADGTRLRLDNHFTMEGSALRGTMTGGALPPALTIDLGPDADAGADADQLREVVAGAVRAAPIARLIAGCHPSRFGLVLDGETVPSGREGELSMEGTYGEPAVDDLTPDDGWADLVALSTPADRVEGIPGGVATSMAESQSRRLHVRAESTIDGDGTKTIVQNLFQPIGSEYRFRAENMSVAGGPGRAPDALTYMAAGIGFCFMTQLGRYASILERPLRAHRIVQDTFFGGVDDDMAARPVETRVFLDSDGAAIDADFARDVVRMGEQTCFLHALCRTDLATEVVLGSLAAESART